MTEGQRQTLHQLLDRMIDEGLEYGVCEYAEGIEIMKTPYPHIPSIWEIDRTRMELTLKKIKEKDFL